MSEFIEIKEASILLHVSVDTMYKLVQNNKVPYYKPHKKILFDKNELENIIKAKRVPATFEVKDLAIKDTLMSRLDHNRKY